MSGIAEVLHSLGYSVTGSDVAVSESLERLRARGVAVAIDHRAENLGDADLVVVSSAIDRLNPEVAAARERAIPVVHRADMLAALMRSARAIAVSGTHGKTTTTALIAHVLCGAGMDPTVINGGVCRAHGSNAWLGRGEWMVVEADESDGTFLDLPATVAVITNIDAEHLDHYYSFTRLRAAFEQFMRHIPPSGFATACIDDEEVRAMIPRIDGRRVVSYGLSAEADVRAEHIRFEGSQADFDVVIRDRRRERRLAIERLRLPMAGGHNVQNALAAIAVGYELGLSAGALRSSLARFPGVKRRFTRIGESHGITIVDDYAHHPVEIAAVLEAARMATAGRVIAVLQPHRYHRLARLFEGFCRCFDRADAVIVADVYAAGEAPIEGVDRDTLVEGLRRVGHPQALPLSDPESLPARLMSVAGPGDLVVCLGAGSITRWAAKLPRQLDELGARHRPAKLTKT